MSFWIRPRQQRLSKVKGKGKTEDECCTYRWVDEVLVPIHRILPRPEPHPLENGHRARLLAGRGAAFILLEQIDLGLDAKNGLLDPRALDLLAVVHGGQPAHVPLGRAVGGIHGGSVGGLDEALGDDVDDALARVTQVGEGVLGGTGGEGAGEADGEERGVVVEHVEVAEGGQVGGLAVRGAGAQEGDGAGHDGGDEELVVEAGWAALLVGVDDDVLLLLLSSACVGSGGGSGVRASASGILGRGRLVWFVEVVGAVTKGPVRVGRLGVPELGVRVPLLARGFRGLEVRVGIALVLVGHGEASSTGW